MDYASIYTQNDKNYKQTKKTEEKRRGEVNERREEKKRENL
jgi:hypothetical protein